MHANCRLIRDDVVVVVVVVSSSCFPAVERLVVSVAAIFKQEMTACLPLHVLQV